MKYWKAPHGEVFGYDETDEAQVALMTEQTGAEGWIDITGSWPPAPSLADAQAAKIAALNAAYQAAITAAVSFTTEGGATARFAQDAQSKANLANCIAAGTKAWKLGLWLDAAGSPVAPFTFTDLQGLAAAMEAADAPQFTDLLGKIAEVNAATTAEQVASITF